MCLKKEDENGSSMNSLVRRILL
jgi:hypothetical protein